jgi:hypothetical protein
MQFFRMRLILALVVGITLVSAASTYFEVLAHKHALRLDLQRRTAWMSKSLQPAIENTMATGQISQIAAETAVLRSQNEALGLAVYDAQGNLVTESGPAEILNALPRGPLDKATKRGVNSFVFGHLDDNQWLEDAIPLYVGGHGGGALIILEDARYIRAEGSSVWRQSLWRVVAFVLLISCVTLLMVRWFLMRPMMRVADRLRRLRMGQPDDLADESLDEMSLFTPLAREVESMAESLIEARAAAETEARLRDAGEHQLDRRTACRAYSRALWFKPHLCVVEPRAIYACAPGRETVCVVPPSGLVTAIEPVLRACDGVWVAHGSGSEDALNVDEFDRSACRQETPLHAAPGVAIERGGGRLLRRLCQRGAVAALPYCAYPALSFALRTGSATSVSMKSLRPRCLKRWRAALNPIVFVQDYHFALVPRLIKAARPDARVAIFWHIPWPNPEAFGICPWQAQLLDGLLGADLIGFHIPLHCNNFLSTVDRVLESRTDREHMTARRDGHTSTVRPYPVSVALDGSKPRAKDAEAHAR